MHMFIFLGGQEPTKTRILKKFSESFTYAVFLKIDHVKIFPFPTAISEPASHRQIGTEENPEHTKMQVH